MRRQSCSGKAWRRSKSRKLLSTATDIECHWPEAWHHRDGVYPFDARPLTEGSYYLAMIDRPKQAAGHPRRPLRAFKSGGPLGSSTFFALRHDYE